MRDACIAKLSIDIDRALCISVLWENMSEEHLRNLLTKPVVGNQDGEHRLRAVCAWIDGGMAINKLHERRHRFRQLLESVDLAPITEGSLIDIISSNYAVTESKPHR